MYSPSEENIILTIIDTANSDSDNELIIEPVSIPLLKEELEPIVMEPVMELVMELVVETIVMEPVAELVVEPIVEPVVEPIVMEPVNSCIFNTIHLNQSFSETSETEQETKITEEIENKNISQEVYPEFSEVYREEGNHTPVEVESEENPLRKEEIMEVEKAIEKVLEKTVEKKIPRLIFVVPYRDRWEQYQFFDDHMRTRILSIYNKEDYLILYAHQTDDRPFNRGAMKNIGFLAGKSLFPNDYQKITFVFNDVDTMPYVKNFLNYETWPGNVKHFYGYHFALGGIVSMTGGDFERINGYPNLFSWSCEDNCLQKRVLDAGLKIDRSQFYPIMDKHILQNKDGLLKVVNRTEHDRVYYGSQEGISNLLAMGDLKYDYVESTGFVNIKQFSTGFDYNMEADKVHNIMDGTNVWKDTGKTGTRQKLPGLFSMKFSHNY